MVSLSYEYSIYLSDSPLIGQYWSNLTAETAFLARVFVEHCKTMQDETKLEANLPVVTNVAFSIEKSYKSLCDMCSEDTSNIDEAERIRREDARIDKECVIAELLKLAVHLDYSDEIGRRKMFQLVREWSSSVCFECLTFFSFRRYVGKARLTRNRTCTLPRCHENFIF